MYTCMFEAKQGGGSCFDPLFYYFPADDKVYDLNDTTFMVGGALKVTPIMQHLEQDQKTLEAYFPNGTWVNLANPKEVIDTTQTGGSMFNISTEQLTVNVHLKSGSMIPF